MTTLPVSIFVGLRAADATVDPRGNEVNADAGYIVGGLVPSLKFDGSESYGEEIVRFFGWLADANNAVGENVLYGSWTDDDGVVHVDVVEHVWRREVAIAKGKARNEIAIWDVANVEAITL